MKPHDGNYRESLLYRFLKTDGAYWAFMQKKERDERQHRLELAAAVRRDELASQSAESDGLLVGELQRLNGLVEKLILSLAPGRYDHFKDKNWLDAFTTFLLDNETELAPYIQHLIQIALLPAQPSPGTPNDTTKGGVPRS